MDATTAQRIYLVRYPDGMPTDADLKLESMPMPRPGADEMHAAHWHDCMPEFETAHFLDGFGHADGKFHFRADWKSLGTNTEGLAEFPDFSAVIDAADDERPFRLVAAPARQFLNTSFTETPGSMKREGRPTVLVHPDAAARLGIADGARIRLGNARGTVVLHARLFDGVQPGVIVSESVWPSECFEGGIGINALTSDEPALPMGGAVFHDTAVWMEAVAAEAALPEAAD